MKLGESKSKIHGMNPLKDYPEGTRTGNAFCGVVNTWYYTAWDSDHYKFYEGSPDLVTCKTCKKLMQKYIVKKLKGK